MANKRKAANLVLERLKEQLERGEMDAEWRERLGVSDEQLRDFGQRLEQRLADQGDDLSPEGQARRRQFEETLRTIEFDSRGRAARGAPGPATRLEVLAAPAGSHRPSIGTPPKPTAKCSRASVARPPYQPSEGRRGLRRMADIRLSRLGDHTPTRNLDILEGTIVRIRLDRADTQDGLEAFRVGRLAECRVLSIEVRHPIQADEDLGTGGIGIAGACHRQDARFVKVLIELGRDGIPWTARAGSLRAADLQHESGNDAMHDDAVVKPDASQTDQVPTMSRGHIGPEVQTNGPHRRLKLDGVCVVVEIHIGQGGIHFSTAIGHNQASLMKLVRRTSYLQGVPAAV